LHRHDDQHHAHKHPGRIRAGWHSHGHVHKPLVHTHAHWPDFHHRHEH
jgi:hypothetical protein